MEKFALVEKSFMVRYTKEVADYCDPFCCGDKDLDEFFKYDVFLYEKELLSKAFCWISKENPHEIIAIATLSFDSIKANLLDNSSRNALQRRIPYKKHHRSYPAILIGRLGVNSTYQGHGLNIGTQLMDVLKHSFVDENNKAACRYMLVDAYNVEPTLHYYFKNGFKPLYKSVDREKLSFGIPEDEELKSRILFFDLKFIDK
ncbi:MAG: GNAT family N-acetyltransferase [Bacteroides sp.]|nr:GNAT family N-acetyltransferase [Bacteroides sp.]